jgi:hypothetical protein
MNPNSPPQQAIDLMLFDRNRRQVPLEYLVPYWGKQVAWSADGTRIVASAETGEEVNEQLLALGIPFDQVVFEYVDDPNEGPNL